MWGVFVRCAPSCQRRKGVRKRFLCSCTCRCMRQRHSNPPNCALGHRRRSGPIRAPICVSAEIPVCQPPEYTAHSRGNFPASEIRAVRGWAGSLSLSSLSPKFPVTREGTRKTVNFLPILAISVRNNSRKQRFTGNFHRIANRKIFLRHQQKLKANRVTAATQK